MDTSFLIALVVDTDVNHQRAKAWRKVVPASLITTEYVLVEFLDALSHPRLRGRAAATLEPLNSDPNVRIVPGSRPLFDGACGMYASHTDKEWGITDCISFVVMRREGTYDALTADHHFEQADFRALHRVEPSTQGIRRN